MSDYDFNSAMIQVLDSHTAGTAYAGAGIGRVLDEWTAIADRYRKYTPDQAQEWGPEFTSDLYVRKLIESIIYDPAISGFEELGPIVENVKAADSKLEDSVFSDEFQHFKSVQLSRNTPVSPKPEDNSDLSDSLTTIGKGLAALRRPSLKLLQAGLSEEAVRAQLEACGLTANDELIALYGWHDGTHTSEAAVLDDLQLFPGFYFLSLEDALTNYQAFGSDDRWDPDWLPVFANGGGDFYVLSLGMADRGRVRHFRIEKSEHPVEFLSLTDFVRTLAEAFSQNVFFVDEQGYLEADDARFAALAAMENPTVNWWTEDV